jgi:hypothetical protein
MIALAASMRRLHADERGFTLTELLVGSVVGMLVMVGITGIIFTAIGVQQRADDDNSLASALSVVSLTFDRDAAMALAAAPARSQVASTACSTQMDLGFLEGGASVRFQTVASGADGPLWLQRVSGGGTRVLARRVQACTWQALQEPGGRWMLRIDLTVSGPQAATMSWTLRAAPRLW